MFERSVNIFFGKQIFKGIPTKVDGKFMHHDPVKNPFREYLKKKTAKAVLTKALMSFCYNTHRHSSYWNIRQKYFYLYHLIKKRGKETYEETLSEDLVNKIIRNIPNEYFMERVQAIIADYHILLDDKGNIIPYEDYPLIYTAGAYLESFPLTFFSEDFTKKELDELGKTCSGNILLINLPDTIKVVKLRGKKRDCLRQGDIVTESFDKNSRGVLDMFLFITGASEKTRTDLREKYSDEAVTNLMKQLCITDLDE